MIEVINVSKSFQKDKSHVHVLDDISFRVDFGEFLTIIGPNGCGKTTLLRLIHGLIQPDKGQILIKGEPVSLPPTKRCIMFQSPNLIPWKSIKENIALPLIFMKMDRSMVEEKVLRMIEFVGLYGFENYYPQQLSGGMQQRAALARALVTDPEILLMDEPLSALDAYTRELFQAEFLRLLERERLTIVYVTHSVDEAVFLSDHILVLSPRPARIRGLISVDLPRPRTMALKNTAYFVSLREKVWTILVNHSDL